MNRKKIFIEGMRDGLPIGLGYLAVSFSLGVAARSAGLNAFQGFLASLLNNASAGEYAGFTVIAAGASYLEMALITLIANARYLLMSCALSQHFAPGTPLRHRLLIGHYVTDEIFGHIRLGVLFIYKFHNQNQMKFERQKKYKKIEIIAFVKVFNITYEDLLND